MSDKQLEQSFTVALAALQAGDLSRAQQLLNDITGTWPDCKEAWYQLGELHQRQGDWSQAVEMYGRVLELDAGIQEVYGNLGLLAAQQQQVEMAIGYWRQALAINPHFHEVRLQLASLLARNGQIPEAIAQLRGLLELAPATEPWLLQQARSLLQQGQLLEASACCQALRQSGSALSEPAILLELQLLHELGLDADAGVLLEGLGEPWGPAMRGLYVPAHYADMAALQAERERLEAFLDTPSATRLPLSVDLPRLRGWDLLACRATVDAWLAAAAGQKSLPPPAATPRPPVQRLVWIADIASLPWQNACWQHLCALPARRWNIQVLLRQPALVNLFVAPQRVSLREPELLPPDWPEARARLQQLGPDVLLFGDTAGDALQFWLAQERFAPVQLDWPGRWPDSDSLWPFLPVSQATGDALIYPLPAAGWHPHDAERLRRLAGRYPLLLLATPAEWPALQQLGRTLAAANVRQALWRQPEELSAWLCQGRALVLPQAGMGPYAAAAASCGLAWIGEADDIPPLLSPAAYEARCHENPYAAWAVNLQDRLARTWRGA